MSEDQPQRPETAGVNIVVTKNPDGYVTVDLTIEDKTFYVEIGETKYSGYLKGMQPETVYFEGDTDAAE
ncbi:MAG TPA: hypothetical protein VH024_17365 [Candidatus Angelobacter sp.]|jgi:hypothetical protein|nr:hypothetical protein [Candidatus Angelobacter sp.]